MVNKYTYDNRAMLATRVIDAMDLNSLVAWAYEELVAQYELNIDQFEEDWAGYMIEAEEEGD